VARDTHGSESSRQRWLRYVGAALVVAAGAVHLQQYFGVYYRVIPIIGPLFLADFVLAVLLALLLVAPVRRVGVGLTKLAALGGVLFAWGAIVGLEISEHGTLLGFHEHGYRLAIVLSLVLEAASILVLTVYLLLPARRADVGSAVGRPVEVSRQT